MVRDSKALGGVRTYDRRTEDSRGAKQVTGGDAGRWLQGALRRVSVQAQKHVDEKDVGWGQENDS